jgi:hypothetical protein
MRFMWVLAGVAACVLTGAVAAVAFLELVFGAPEREARRAGEELRLGMNVADLLRVAEASAAADSWTLGLQECPGTSDVFAMNYSNRTNRYEMWAIRNWQTRAEEVWRESSATREHLTARAGKPVGRHCRSAKLWFGGQWRIDIQLDSEGRVQKIEPTRLMND